MKTATVEVNTCSKCPHIDDANRCSLLDNKGYECYGSSVGIRHDCPLEDADDDKSTVTWIALSIFYLVCLVLVGSVL